MKAFVGLLQLILFIRSSDIYNMYISKWKWKNITTYVTIIHAYHVMNQIHEIITSILEMQVRWNEKEQILTYSETTKLDSNEKIKSLLSKL